MNDTLENVILVTENDGEIGTMPKLQAHQDGGRLHRAFSVYVLNANGQLLMQQRANSKYHSAGLWANTACGHPRPEEKTYNAAQRRLLEEMGMCEVELELMLTTIYKAEVGNGLTEYELLHVFVGKSDDQPVKNPTEVQAYSWDDLDYIERDLDNHSEKYAAWFPIIFPKVLPFLE